MNRFNSTASGDRTVVSLLGIAAAVMLSACAAPAAKPNQAEADDNKLQIDSGWLQGYSEGGISSFKAIPYAQPPIGELRWQPPQPADSWPDVRDATAFGPSCVQPGIPRASVYYDPLDNMSEDCLSLNIWAPDNAENEPVIVWIHGGSLTTGGAAQPLYDGTPFAQHGTVFVSINYRLGVLGWLAHPELSKESGDNRSGNYGLLDQIAALEWVQDNISEFGGDANNVTIMGESAGALSVSYLLSSPLADDLFDKAILQSVNSRAFPALRDSTFGIASAESIGSDLLTQLDIPDLEAARSVDADTLVTQARRARFVSQGTIDGDILPRQIVDQLDKNSPSVPILAGFNSGEARTYKAFLPKAPGNAQAYDNEIKFRYGDLANEFLALYPGDDIAESMQAALRDAIFGWATERIVQGATSNGQPSYFYLFDYCYPSAREAGLCAFHASELPFVFADPDGERLKPSWPSPDGAADRQISDAMLDYWTSFAATGTPHSDYGPDWQPYQNEESYLHIGETLALERNPIPGMLELHEKLVQERKSMDQSWFADIGLAAKPRQ